MAYQVIARKYRPQRFSDVVGQEHVTQTLSHAIEQKRIAHAYLFCGPRGTGKTTIARIFAKCLNCTGGPKVDFADDDPRCVEIAEGRSIDVLEIDGASNRGIEEIRELRETVKYMPASSKYKIYIIDEVHMLTKEAFNALLKTLEEPPEHVKFMFATTEPEKVLPTILSRCQRFDLRRIPVKLITQHLGEIAGKENVKIEPAALYAIARGAEGCMRDAESALDQLISFCGENVTEEDVLSMFGLTAQGQIFSLASAILKGESETVLNTLGDLTKHGKDLARLLADLLGYFRNLLILQVAGAQSGMLETSEAEGAMLREHAKLVNTESLTRVMEVLTDAEARLREVTSKKIFIEIALLKAINARAAVSIDTVLQQLQKMRGGESTSAAPAASSPKPAAGPVGGRASPRAALEQMSAMQISANPDGDPGVLWQDVLRSVGPAIPLMLNMLASGSAISFEKNVLTIGFAAESAESIDIVSNPKTVSLIQARLGELGYANAQVRFTVSERAVNSMPATEAPAPMPSVKSAEAAQRRPAATAKEKPAPETLNTEDFKNDPLIRKALEIFKGNIVEVRAEI